jgi:Zn-dependent protease
VAQGKEGTVVGRVFGTPVIVKGLAWLPLVEIAAAAFLAWLAGRRQPLSTRAERWRFGLLAMPVVVGSEWVHNFAHAGAARLIGRPMDALRIAWGTPLCVYLDINDPSVRPREHIIRALGGPLANAGLWLLARMARRLARPGSEAWHVAQAAVATNAFLSTAALLPIPGIDGGPVLKWSLVARGHGVAQADAVVRRVNGPLAAGLGAAAYMAFRRRRWLLGGLIGQFAVLALGVALGWIRETGQGGSNP